MGIEDILMHDETLFSNINAFDPDYVPPNYNYRDIQMEGMAMAIRPAMSGGQPSNAVILGSPATGKTTAIKKIFGHVPPETGVPFARVYDSVMKELQRSNRALILSLDDVNYLFQSKTANKIFYDILRAYEEYPGVKTAIFAILSDLEFKFVLDKNVNTVFIPHEITFPPYSYTEIENILRDRVKAGFYPNVMSDEVLEEIATYTFDNGDLRTGINLLRNCGNIAEADASKEITMEHFNKAIDSLVSVNVSQLINSLTDIERSLLELIVDSKDNISAGDLGEAFRQKEKVSYASYNRTLDKLEFMRLIDTKYTGSGSVGNSREVILRFDPDDYDI